MDASCLHADLLFAPVTQSPWAKGQVKLRSCPSSPPRRNLMHKHFFFFNQKSQIWLFHLGTNVKVGSEWGWGLHCFILDRSLFIMHSELPCIETRREILAELKYILSLIDPDLIKRFTRVFSCLHLLYKSHCFSFSECVKEGRSLSWLLCTLCQPAASPGCAFVFGIHNWLKP